MPEQNACPNCGTLQPIGAQVCSKCGYRLVQSTLAISRGEIDTRDCTLRIIPDQGEAFTVSLMQPLVNIGSDADQEIQIAASGIASYHARLRQEGGNYRLYNIVGPKGVLVNQKPVDNSQVLRDGDMVRLQNASGQGVTINYSNPVERAMGSESKTVGQMIPFATFPFTIGRDPASSLTLHTLAVSWHHAQILDEGGHHVLTDLKSTNGTFVNDRQTRGPYRLRQDDVIRIDQVLLVYKGNGLQRLPSLQRFQLDATSLAMTYHEGLFNRRAKTTMNDVSLAIKPQEFVAVIGGSGSGKSTLLRALNGAQPATAGQVRVNGDDLYRKYGLYHMLIGYVPQADIVHDNLSVYQSLWYGARLRFPNEPHAAREQRITRVLEQLELLDFRDQLVGSLSGGQKKRVSIALELMAEPSLLFMDEPTSGLDPGLDKAMMNTLRRLADRGHVVVVVTHTTLNIDQCDQLAFMSRGHLAYFGPPKGALAFFEARDYAEVYNRVLQAPDQVMQEKTGSDTMISRSPVGGIAAPPKKGEKISPVETSRRWMERFKATPLYQQYITGRMHPLRQTEEDKESLMAGSHLEGQRGTFFQQLQVLTERTLALVRRDMRTMIALLLVLPLVGLFLGLISYDPIDHGPGKMFVSRGTAQDISALLDKLPTAPFGGQFRLDEAKGSKFVSIAREIGTFTPASDAQRLLFMMGLSVTLVGMFAAAYTIVTEKSLYLRERMVNLRILPYILSKVLVYGGLSILSCLVFVIVLAVGVQLPDKGLITWGPLEIFITLVLTALAGVCIGLLLSAISHEVNGVTYAMLAVLFVQILFPGVLFKMDGALEPLSRLTITRWSLEALGGTTDITTRSAEGRIFLRTQIVDAKTEKPLESAPPGTKQFPAPPSLSVTYATQPSDLLVRWGALLGFSIVFLVGASLALNRSESF